MASRTMLRRIGILCTAALFAAGVAGNPVHAQTTDKPKTHAQKAKKQKSPGKKAATQSQSEPARGSGMSGYPETGY